MSNNLIGSAAHGLRAIFWRALAVPTFCLSVNAIALAFTLTSTSAYAQQEAPADSSAAGRVAILGDLDAIQSSEMVYKAKAAEGKAKEEAAKYDPNSPSQASSSNAAADSSNELPTFTDVFGGASGNRAVFMLPGGNTATRGKGEQLPGGYTVVSVSLNDVAVSKNGKVYHLSSGNAPMNTRAQQQQATQSYGMGGFPPGGVPVTLPNPPGSANAPASAGGSN
ncbi:type IV pilus biogenesis protein PilP (plasmid) [Dyella sp. BiH032]|uniref:type IV pilus biogenesis protein PilP n=1 Tax=Dyella sp. BiH032 TaxID=3075430 RepID=UPI002892C0C3|nr:type IV pilus biogenesis protein PilP [Dyella sp. BiH032]WNL48554.1 type IV pilus biogenesis protein PilP [Dyella sp. BiH032]